MKPDRFGRTKSVMASSAIALVVAALIVGVSSLVSAHVRLLPSTSGLT